jgi:hypothetical protein
VRSCSHCGKPIDAGQLVVLNGFPYHAKGCFAAGLRQRVLKPKDVAIALDPSMQPLVAYEAGKETAARLRARRPRKKRAK